MKKLLFIAGIAGLLAGCGSRPDSDPNAGKAYPLAYARGFTVEQHDDYVRVDIRNPWDTTKLLRTYLLVPDSLPVPDRLPKGTLVRTPVKRIVAYASAHCGMLEVIGAGELLAGVCEPRYVNLDFVRKGIADGTMVDVGEAFSPNIEKIIELEPDIIIATPIENMGYGQVEKIGVPLIEATEYLETTPLGRTEWIRFFGLLCGREAEADSVFRSTEQAYHEVRAIAAGVADRPVVLTEYKIGQVWYVPGGGSFMAHLYRDAGADYPWSDEKTPGSLTLSVEAVMERGVDADVWVMKYNRPGDMTYAELESDYPGYARFAPFKNKRIFACNTGRTPYYDEVPVYPDRVLKDLVWVFHPELLPGYEPRYFHRMPE